VNTEEQSSFFENVLTPYWIQSFSRNSQHVRRSRWCSS